MPWDYFAYNMSMNLSVFYAIYDHLWYLKIVALTCHWGWASVKAQDNIVWPCSVVIWLVWPLIACMFVCYSMNDMMFYRHWYVCAVCGRSVISSLSFTLLRLRMMILQPHSVALNRLQPLDLTNKLSRKWCVVFGNFQCKMFFLMNWMPSSYS